MFSLVVLVSTLSLSLALPAPQQGDWMDVWTCDPTSVRQQWTIQNGSAPNARIILRAYKNQTLVMDDANWSNSTNAPLHLWTETPNNNMNQMWSYDSNGHIVNLMNGMCVDVISGAVFDGMSLVLNDCKSGSSSQTWSYDASTGLIHSAANTSICLDGGTANYQGNCTSGPISKYAYCNVSLPLSERVADLVSRMSAIEKTQLLQNSNRGVPRLGFPNIPFGEALHGVLSDCGASSGPDSTGCPTSFPHALHMGASFNRTLWTLVGEAISYEGRALHNQGAWGGLVAWAPDVNLFVDPRWGRGQEVCGEDPVLNAEYAAHYITAMVGEDEAPYDRVASTAKHFSVYGRENPGDETRHSFDAVVSMDELVDFFWVPWRSVVQRGRAKSIMMSYNAVNGVPSVANSYFNNEIIRKQWGWELPDSAPTFVVSDCGAINDVYANHHYVDTPEAAAKAALQGGTDVDCGSIYGSYLYSVYEAGNVSTADLDQAVTRVLGVAFRLGLADPVELNPYSSLGPETVDTPAHRTLALEAARQGMTLVQNSNSVLPLSSSKKLAIVGPNANATQTLLSNYHGTNTLVNQHSILQAATARGLDVVYAQGCEIDSNDKSGFDEAVAAAKSADVTVLVMGLDETQEHEGHDRINITFPGVQQDLIDAVTGATSNPVVLVLVNGGCLAVEDTVEKVDAILEARYPGELGGDAVVEALLGDFSPAGRLTTTWYQASYVQARSPLVTELKPNGSIPGQTYQYFNGTVNFPFGWGLSYTTFKLTPVNTPLDSLHTDSLHLTHGPDALAKTFADYLVNVTNTGTVTSDYVLLGFINATSTQTYPLRQLFDFARVSQLAPGQTVTVTLSMPLEVLLKSDPVTGKRYADPKNYLVSIGDLPEGPQDTLVFPLQVTGPRKLIE